METNSINLTGKQGSGKSFLAKKIASIVDSNKVLVINECAIKTTVGIAREIGIKKYDLIIFEECSTKKNINYIDRGIRKYLKHNCIDTKMFIYITQVSFKKSNNFQILPCKPNQSYATVNHQPNGGQIIK